MQRLGKGLWWMVGTGESKVSLSQRVRNAVPCAVSWLSEYAGTDITTP